jgi:4-oxalocrotonate tautomerase
VPIIKVSMLSERTLEQKRELVEKLTAETARIVQCPLEAVTVVIVEMAKENWAEGGVLFVDK